MVAEKKHGIQLKPGKEISNYGNNYAKCDVQAAKIREPFALVQTKISIQAANAINEIKRSEIFSEIYYMNGYNTYVKKM